MMIINIKYDKFIIPENNENIPPEDILNFLQEDANGTEPTRFAIHIPSQKTMCIDTRHVSRETIREVLKTVKGGRIQILNRTAKPKHVTKEFLMNMNIFK